MSILFWFCCWGGTVSSVWEVYPSFRFSWCCCKRDPRSEGWGNCPNSWFGGCGCHRVQVPPDLVNCPVPLSRRLGCFAEPVLWSSHWIARFPWFLQACSSQNSILLRLRTRRVPPQGYIESVSFSLQGLIQHFPQPALYVLCFVPNPSSLRPFFANVI